MTTTSSGPVLRAISPDASEEEVAAVIAAITACSGGGGGAAPPADEHLDEWMRRARLVSRRVGRVRGPWRFSGRTARRTRP